MTNSTVQAFYIALSLLLFTAGLAYTVSTITQVSAEFDEIQDHERSPYFMETNIPEEILFTGAEVIGSLNKLNFEGLTVNLNGVLFNNAKEFNDKQHYISTYAYYKQTFDFNTDGSVKTIYFTLQ